MESGKRNYEACWNQAMKDLSHDLGARVRYVVSWHRVFGWQRLPDQCHGPFLFHQGPDIQRYLGKIQESLKS